MTVPTAHHLPWTRKHDKPGTPLLPDVATVAFPSRLEHLIELCNHGSQPASLHAAGSHWALSPAAISDATFVETHDFNNVFPALGRTLRDVLPSCATPQFLDWMTQHPTEPFFAGMANPDRAPLYYAHVESGKRIFQMYAELDQGDTSDPASLASHLISRTPHLSTVFSQRWAASTLGGAGGQTIVGALTTGTHGGDFDRPPLADSVVALHLVTDGGTHYWIERFSRNGKMADHDRLVQRYGTAEFGGPDKFKVHYCEAKDDLFNAALVQVGRFGIIYSVVLQVQAQYELRQSVELTTWESTRSLIADPMSTLFQQPSDGDPQRFLQVVVCPAPQADGSSHLCGITRRWTKPLSAGAGSAERVGAIVQSFDPQLNAPRFSHAGNQPAFDPANGGPSLLETACQDGDFAQGIVNAVAHEISTFLQNNAVAVGGGLALASTVGAPLVAALLPELLAILAILAALLALWEALNPQRLGQALNDVRGALLSDPTARGAGILAWRAISGKVFESQQSPGTMQAISYAVMDTHDYTDVSCQVNVDSVEVFFEATDPNLIVFVDRLLSFENDQEWNEGRAVVGYISLRFTEATQALIGPQLWARSVAVECSGLVDVDGSEQFVTFATQLALDPNINGVLHWGQRNDSSAADVEFRFNSGGSHSPDRLTRWRNILSQLTDRGLHNAFSSNFTRQTGLEP